MGWIIAGAVVAVILILLMTSVKVRFEYADPGELRLKINWFFVTLVQIPAKTKKQKRRDKKAEKDVRTAAKDAAKAEETASAENAGSSARKSPDNSAKTSPGLNESKKPAKTKQAKQEKQKLTLKDIFALAKLVWDSLGKPLKRLLKATRIYGFRLYMTVGGEDAADAAIHFGRVNIAAGSALAFLDGCFTLKEPDMNITCDFESEETRTECAFTAKLTLIAALAFLFWVVGSLVRNYLSRKDAAAAVDKLRK